MIREIRGRHVALGFGFAFSVITGVNLLLATQAVRTFPGLEVKNSYVASQSFDRDRAAQQSLGWTARADLDGDLLSLRITGQSDDLAPARIIEAKLGRASFAAEDRELVFRQLGDLHLADASGLGAGLWYLWITAEASDGTLFRQRLELWVAP